MAEVPDEYLKALGPELGAIYHALCDDVTWLHFKWKQYRILFAESEARVDLLNKVGGAFFLVIQEVIRDDVLMHIARLIDPENSGKNKDNLSLWRLASAVKINAPQIFADMDVLVKQAHEKARFVEDWRHHRLAHTDLDIALGRRATPLPGIAREQIEEFLGALRAALNKIVNHFWERTIGFEHIYADRDAEDLVRFLKWAVDAKKKDSAV